MYYYNIRNYILETSILCFLALYILVHVIQPGMLYDHNGLLREFGVNQKNKTIFPAWLIAIVLAIISYLGVLFYNAYPRIMNRYG